MRRAYTSVKAAILAALCLISTAPAFADPDAVRQLYRDGGAYLDDLVATYSNGADPAGTLQPGSERHHVRLLAARDRLRADEAEIGRIDDWIDVLSRRAADSLGAGVEAYAYAIGARAKERSDAARLRAAGACETMLAALEPLEAEADAIWRSADPELDRRRALARLAPQFAVHRDAYLRSIETIVSAYRDWGAQLQRERAHMARGAWRLVRFYEALGNRDEAEKLKRRLIFSARLPFREPSGDGAFYFTLHDAYLNTGQHCVSWTGVGPLRLDTPRRGETMRDFLQGSAESFDTEAVSVPTVRTRGTGALERIAEILTVHTIQRFRLEDQIAEQTRAVSARLAAGAREAAVIELVMRARAALNTVRDDITPAEERAQRIDDAERELARTERDVTVADERLAAARQDAEAVAARSGEVRVVRLGDGVRAARNSREGRPAADLLADIDRQSTLLDTQSAAVGAEIDRILATPRISTDALQRYEDLLAQKRAIDLARDRARRLRRDIAAIAQATTGAGPDLAPLTAAVDAARQARTAAAAALAAARAAGQRPSSAQLSNEAADLYASARLAAVDARVPGAGELPLVLPRSVAAGGDPAAVLRAVDAVDDAIRGLDRVLTAAEAQARETRGRLAGEAAQLRALEQRRASAVALIIRAKITAADILQRELPEAGADGDGPVVSMMDDYARGLGAVRDGLANVADLLDYPNALQGKLDSLNALLDTRLALPAPEARARLEGAQAYVGAAVEAAETLQGKLDTARRAVSVAEQLGGDNAVTMQNAFRYITSVLDGTSTLLGDVPIVGAVAGVYVDYLAQSLAVISERATEIRERDLAELFRLGVARPPERHLYTAAEILDAPASAQLFDRFRGDERRQLLTILQARRVIALMAARSISEACNQPRDPALRVNCVEQGPL